MNVHNTDTENDVHNSKVHLTLRPEDNGRTVTSMLKFGGPPEELSKDLEQNDIEWSSSKPSYTFEPFNVSCMY